MARESIYWWIRADALVVVCLCVLMADLANALSRSLTDFRQLSGVSTTLLLLNSTRVCSYCAVLLIIASFGLKHVGNDSEQRGSKGNPKIEDRSEDVMPNSFTETESSSEGDKDQMSWQQTLHFSILQYSRALITTIQVLVLALISLVAILGVVASLSTFKYSTTLQILRSVSAAGTSPLQGLKRDTWALIPVMHDYNKALYGVCCGVMYEWNSKIEVCSNGQQQDCVFSKSYFDSLLAEVACSNRLKFLAKTSSCRDPRVFSEAFSQLWASSADVGAQNLFILSLSLVCWLGLHGFVILLMYIALYQASSIKKRFAKQKSREESARKQTAVSAGDVEGQSYDEERHLPQLRTHEELGGICVQT